MFDLTSIDLSHVIKKRGFKNPPEPDNNKYYYSLRQTNLEQKCMGRCQVFFLQKKSDKTRLFRVK